jgi:hypothetical protein
VLFKPYFDVYLWVYMVGSNCYGEVIGLAKIRLFVRVRNQNRGSYVASVPLKQLVKLSGYDKRRWSFEDGWLVLEAF